MADFLSKLAGRALGMEPAAQPLVAPMYAPGPELLAGAPDGAAHDVENVADDGAGVPDAPSVAPEAAPANLPSALVPSPVPEPPEQPVVVRTQAGPREPAAEQWINAGIAEDEAPLEPTGRASDGRLTVSGEPPPSPRASREPLAQTLHDWPRSEGAGELPAPRAARAARAAPRREEIGLPHGLPALDLQPAAPTLPVHAPLAGEETAAARPLPVRVAVREAAAPWPTVPGPPGEGEPERGKRDEQGEPPEPAIRITIGRVEVRAVMQTPPSPAPPESPAPPRLSLDEYLRSEIGGSR